MPPNGSRLSCGRRARRRKAVEVKVGRRADGVARGVRPIGQQWPGHSEVVVLKPPNGSRLSCGRKARRRKAVEAQRKRLAGEATQLFPTGERPPASSAC